MIRPHILTNMAFWQSRVWTENTRSIYPMANRRDDPAFDSPLKEACKLFVRRGDSDVVVTMGARHSLLYGMMCLLTLRESRQIMTEVFLDDARPNSLLWRLKTRGFQAVARRATGVLTNSSAEVGMIASRFRIPESRVRYVPMHSNIHSPEFIGLNDGFVLAAGRTRRDYATLLQAAPQIACPILIIAGTADSFPSPLPKDVRILRDVSRSVYLDCLRRCSLLVLPLLPTERSTGQVVLLEAMALGKPVVASRVAGTTDLIRHGRNGIVVEPCSAAELAAGVRSLLDQPDLARQMGMNAVEDVKKFHTFDVHAQAKLDAIRELWQASGAEARRA